MDYNYSILNSKTGTVGKVQSDLLKNPTYVENKKNIKDAIQFGSKNINNTSNLIVGTIETYKPTTDILPINTKPIDSQEYVGPHGRIVSIEMGRWPKIVYEDGYEEYTGEKPPQYDDKNNITTDLYIS